MTIIIVKGHSSSPTRCPDWIRYKSGTKSKTVFVSTDKADDTNILLSILDRMKVGAIVAKHTGHPDFKAQYKRIEMFEENNYFDAFVECVIGIMDIGSILSNAMYYGLPCLVLTSDDKFSHCCVPIELNEGIIETRVSWLMANEYQRECISRMALHEYSR